MRGKCKRVVWGVAGLCAAFLAGCVSGSGVVVSDTEPNEEANEGEMSVADLLAKGKCDAAEMLARVRMAGGRHPFSYANSVVRSGSYAGLDKKYHEFEPSSESDITMRRLDLCAALLLQGKKAEAHDEMQKARDELESMFDPESQALKPLHGEREKFFKGDGYERATLYAFLALSFLDRGDFGNAIKCAQYGFLADSDSEQSENRADYALLPYIGYIAAVKAGANWEPEAKNYARIVKELTGVSPAERPLPTALLVLWSGRGSDRVLGGEFGELRYVRKGSTRGWLDSFSVVAGGVECASLPNLANLNYQAATRGRREMDNVLDRKAMVKRGLIASSNVLLAFGAGCLAAGTASGDGKVAIVMWSVGGLCVALGYPTHLLGMAINVQADDRCWQTLPGRLDVVPLSISRGRSEISILGYRRLDNVMYKKVELDFSGASGNGIPVCHFSLIADRDAIEDVVEKGITAPIDEIAARTKEDAYADKIELTGEGGR